MKIEKLIKTLEGAMKKATMGEWDCSPMKWEDGGGVDFSDIPTTVIINDSAGYNATLGDAQAIAVRHNTAGEVLVWLKSYDEAVSQAVASSTLAAENSRLATEAATGWRTRAERAEKDCEHLRGELHDRELAARHGQQIKLAHRATCDVDERCELVPEHKGPCGRYPSGPGYWAPL